MMLARWLAISFLAVPFAVAAQFSAPSVLLTDDAADPFTAIDLDGDGDLDLVRPHAQFGLIAYTNFDGQGSYTFGGTLLNAEPIIGQWTLGDADGDGLPDVMAELGDGNLIHLALNLGNGQFGTPQPVLAAPGAVAAIAMAEINGDGLHDLVVAVDIDDAPSVLLWCPNLGGLFGGTLDIGGPIGSPIGPFIRHGDLDHSGGNDLVVMDGSGTVLVLRNVDGDGNAWAKNEVFDASSALLASPQLLDLDGDGDLDLGEAAFPDVRWIENTLDEGGSWTTWVYHQLEPWISAGPGAFGQLGCGTGAGLAVFPMNPSAFVRYAHWAAPAGAFTFANEMPLPRGTMPLLADANGDGRDDLILFVEGERLLFLNQLEPANTVIDLPELPALCKFGQPYALPTALPEGGHWVGTNIFNDELLRSNVIGQGLQPLAHIVYEPQGCAAAVASGILVVEQPVISPSVSNVLCAADGPIQFTSVPPATQWIGTDEWGALHPVPYQQGVVVALFTDATGETCAAESDPFIVWPSMPAQIAAAGPFCVNSGAQVITANIGPGVDYTWAGSIVGYNSAGATFSPSIGTGVHPVVLLVEPNQPGYCEGIDTLWVSVSDDFPEVVVQSVGPHCASSDPIDLSPLGLPAGGIWSGPAVAQGSFYPNQAGAGNFFCTYTYASPTGCSSSEAVEIKVIGESTVSVDSDDLVFCTTEEPAHFIGLPAGGEWTAPISTDGVLDPMVVSPGDYPVLYTWTGADGCTVVNATATLYVLVTTEPTIDPVTSLCAEDGPVEITGSPSGIWSGSANGAGSSVWLNPALLGAGVWPVTLTASEAGECAGTTTVEVLIEVCTGTEDAAPLTLVVWPNPFGEHLYLEVGAEALTGLEMLEATGRVVRAIGPMAAGTRLAIQLSDTPAGAYFLRWTGISGGSGALRVVRW